MKRLPFLLNYGYLIAMISGRTEIRELKNTGEIKNWLKSLDERGQTTIALDIEGEFNLHCYGEHLCLIQIFDGKDKLIIDPIKLNEPDKYREIFEKRELLKIMYDSLSDASLLKNEYGIKVKSILDLRPAVTLLEFQKQSLSNVQETALGLKAINKKKFQKYNWMNRPVNPEAMEYAMGDVIHLYKLKDELFQRLISRDLMEKFIHKNIMIQNGIIKNNKPDRYKRAKGYRHLSNTGQRLFRDFFTIRDRFAQKVNRPPDYVFRNADLLSLCKDEVKNISRIESGINPRINEKIRKQFAAELRIAAGMEG